MRRVPRLPINPPVLIEAGKNTGRVSKRHGEVQRSARPSGATRRWARFSFQLHLQIDPWKSRLV
jgi:hypothetical protein